jgi:5-methylcytosine-specific restriction endonuclease McrA
VIERDGGLCVWRLPGCTIKATTADHKVPVADGGPDDESNLVASCDACNETRRRELVAARRTGA